MYIDLPLPLTDAIDASIAFVYSLEEYVAPTVVLGEIPTVKTAKATCMQVTF
jgi:hypothetical protein